MSNSLFPTSTQLPGTDIKIVRTPIWDTIVQQAVSGKETRIARRIYPRRTYELQFNFLRSSTLAPFNPVSNELATLEGFFNNRQGMYDSFLFTDPENYTTVNQSLGTGNGTNTQFQLVTTFGGFVEPVYAPTTNTVVVYKTDWQGTNAQYTTPRTNLIPYSQAISTTNSWGAANCTASTGAGTAPDGTMTASFVTMTTSPTGSQGMYKSGLVVSTGIAFEFSIFLQPSSNTRWFLTGIESGTASTATALAWYDLTNGVTGNSSASTSATVNAVSIASYSGGWYRCGINATLVSTQSILVLFEASSGEDDTQPVSTTASFYAWGAQLEQDGASPTPYIATSSTSTTVTDISYTGWPSSSPGLITFAIAPVSGATITTNMSYNFPVRFTQDDMNFTRFVNLIYEGKKLEFETII